MTTSPAATFFFWSCLRLCLLIFQIPRHDLICLRHLYKMSSFPKPLPLKAILLLWKLTLNPRTQSPLWAPAVVSWAQASHDLADLLEGSLPSGWWDPFLLLWGWGSDSKAGFHTWLCGVLPSGPHPKERSPHCALCLFMPRVIGSEADALQLKPFVNAAQPHPPSPSASSSFFCCLIPQPGGASV